MGTWDRGDSIPARHNSHPRNSSTRAGDACLKAALLVTLPESGWQYGRSAPKSGAILQHGACATLTNNFMKPSEKTHLFGRGF